MLIVLELRAGITLLIWSTLMKSVALLESTALHPAPTPLSFSTAALPPCLHGVDSKAYSALVRKSVPSRQILVANNDWWLEESKVDLIAPYWAEVGLRVAERVLHDHMGMAKPAWLDEQYFESSVLGI